MAFATALVRTLYPKTRRVWLRKALAVGERFLASGTVGTRDEMPEILDGLMAGKPPWALPAWASIGVCCISGFPLGWPMCLAADVEHPGVVVGLIRDVMPNPFRPPVVRDDWRTSTVRALVGAIEAGPRLDLMPILADALQDAGCEDGAVLDHLRGPGPHTRACWVLERLRDGS
jgi:hypothetical protein